MEKKIPRVVNIAHILANSHSYQNTKLNIRHLIIDRTSRWSVYFDITMILVVIISIGILLYDATNDLGRTALLIENTVVVIFILDYLVRLWLHSDIHQQVISDYKNANIIAQPYSFWSSFKAIVKAKTSYMLTPLAIIDLLAIIPAYRPLRLLRIFLLFRLLKLFRYSRSVNELVSVLSQKRFELYTLLGFFSFVLISASAAIYLFEVNNPESNINSVFDAFYWAVITLTTVGYGDITPVSAEGRIVTIVLVVSGVGVVAFFTSIIVSAFGERMPLVRERRILTILEKRNQHIVICGYNRTVRSLAKNLDPKKYAFVILDNNEDKINQATNDGFFAVLGDGTNSDKLRALSVDKKASHILCFANTDTTNLHITIAARHLNKNINIITQVKAYDNVQKMRFAGANHIMSPSRLTGLLAIEFITQPVVFETIGTLFSLDSPYLIDSIKVNSKSAIVGLKIDELGLHQHSVKLIGIVLAQSATIDSENTTYPYRKNHFLFRPPNYYELKEGDSLIVCGHQLNVMRLQSGAIING